MKRILLTILYPFFVFLSFELHRLKKYCLSGNANISQAMYRLSFFHPVANMPSIIFGQPSIRNTDKDFPLWRAFGLVAFLKLSIKQGFFNNKKGHSIALQAGVHSDFVIDMRRLLFGTGNDCLEYQLPERSKEYLHNKKICVYSVLIGNHDVVHEPIVPQYSDGEASVDYIMFTNNRGLQSNVWDFRYVESELDDIIFAREIRMRPHKYLPEYDICIYVDASILIYGNITQMVKFIDDDNYFIITKHPERKTIKDEAFAYAKRAGVSPEIAKKQYDIYMKEGYPDNIPMVETGFLVIKNNEPTLIELLEEWYNGFCRCLLKSDQLPLLPAIYKLNFHKYMLLAGSVWCNQFFMVLPHAKAIKYY